MIELAEILPYLCIIIGFVVMVFVARHRREIFTEEPTIMPIPQSARNIPVDRVDSPYRINIDDSRATLKGRF